VVQGFTKKGLKSRSMTALLFIKYYNKSVNEENDGVHCVLLGVNILLACDNKNAYSCGEKPCAVEENTFFHPGHQQQLTQARHKQEAGEEVEFQVAVSK